MQIPFYETVLNSNTLLTVCNFENHNLKITNNKDHISIEFKNSLPASLYYFISHDDRTFYFSFDEELLYKEIEGCYTGDYEVNIHGHGISDNCKQIHKHLCLFCVRLYENMKVYPKDIKYDIMNDFYTIPIREAGDIVKDWINRYTNMIHDVQKDKTLVVELSAGLDTRSLTYFWIDSNLDKVVIYSKLGGDGEKLELPIAKKITKYISEKKECDLKLYTDKSEIQSNKITLSGKEEMFGVLIRDFVIERF